ncbi:MAG: radical SAM/SPASM domain-containing protein [Desulfotalea sp.]|nr:MAG: radical SAM/SPASM domain-containing protein [Desulfotalea sp.]
MTCLGDQLGMEFSPQEIAKAREQKGLLSLELELSRACDLRCVYCYAASGVALAGELTLTEIYSVIDQAVGLGVKKIIVLGGGEPLIYPNLFVVLEYIKEKELRCDLFTNGQTLDAAVAGRLFELKVGVVLKMNSRVPEVQDFLGGRKGTCAAIEKGLAALRKAGYPSEDCSLGIETIICRQNYKELPGLWRWARLEGIAPYVEAMTMQGRACEHQELEVSPGEIKTLFEELSRIDRDEFLCNWQPHPPLAASHCARHEYSCTVTAIGDVQPCPGVNVAVGNIRETSLVDILHKSPVIDDLRNIRSRIKGQCRGCDNLDHCYGCRGHAYHVTGDYLAEDPLCWLGDTDAGTTLS